MKNLGVIALTVGFGMTACTWPPPSLPNGKGLIKLEKLKLGMKMTEMEATRKLKALGFMKVNSFQDTKSPGFRSVQAWVDSRGRTQFGGVQVFFCRQRITQILGGLRGAKQAAYMGVAVVKHVLRQAEILGMRPHPYWARPELRNQPAPWIVTMRNNLAGKFESRFYSSYHQSPNPLHVIHVSFVWQRSVVDHDKCPK
jgi:hypothetical protein